MASAPATEFDGGRRRRGLRESIVFRTVWRRLLLGLPRKGQAAQQRDNLDKLLTWVSHGTLPWFSNNTPTLSMDYSPLP